jgi:hypothetical protein
MIGNLHAQLGRLELAIRCAGDQADISPQQFQATMIGILAALREVAQAATLAIEPYLAEEANRAIAAAYWRSRAGQLENGEA